MSPGSPRSHLSTIIVSALTASFLAFAAFSINVFYGRFAPFFGWDPGLRLERVPEFGLLFTSAVLFIVAALAAERRAADASSKPQTTDEGGQA